MPSPPRGLTLHDLALTDQTDETGRLLLEDAAPPRAKKFAHRAGIAMDTAPCPYKDTPSRDGGTMNVSAYEAFRQHTAEVINGFAWTTERCIEASRPGLVTAGSGPTGPDPAVRTPLKPVERSSVPVLLECSNVVVTLPVVLFFRAEDAVPPQGALPAYIASLFKAARGIFSVAFDMANRSGLRDAVVTSRAVIEFADENRHMARKESGRVCAAPTRLIERALDSILTGEGARPESSGLSNFVNFPTLWEFYSVQRKFRRSSSDYGYLFESLTRDLGDDPRRLFAATVEVDGRPWSFGDLTDAFVDYVNVVQQQLNELLGRSADARRLTLEDALKLL